MKNEIDLAATYHNAQRMPAIALKDRPLVGRVAADLKLLSMPVPRPTCREVAIEMVASAMHIDEIYAAQGTALGRFAFGKRGTGKSPYIMGSIASGTVVAVGKKVVNYAVGDQVVVVPNETGESGSWATYRCVPEKYVMHMPRALTHIEAAASILSSCVACGALKAVDLKVGNKAVVVGASGAIGSMLVQFLKAKSVHVTAVCSGANEGIVRALGADDMIDYTTENFGNYRTGKFDAVFDAVGGLKIEKAAFKVLRPKGRFVTVVGPVRYLGERRLSRFEFFSACAHVLWRSFSTLFGGPRYRFVATPPKKVAREAIYKVSKTGAHTPLEMRIPLNLHDIKEAIKVLTSHRARGRIVIDFTIPGSRV